MKTAEEYGHVIDLTPAALRHAEKAAQDYGLDTREIPVELGGRKMGGGQEDMIVDLALDMVKAKGN